MVNSTGDRQSQEGEPALAAPPYALAGQGGPPPTAIGWIAAGLLPYRQALDLQERLLQARRAGEIDDHLITLQHPPVITVGRGGGLEDLHVSEQQLRSLGVELVETNRGGRATYHGPGQLVAYPIIKLLDRDLHAYLWKLEESVIRLLQVYGIPAEREERYPGVWVGAEKIAAIGVAVRSDVTMHGLALNVNTDLKNFALFTPCGITDRGVTSMQAKLGYELSLEEVEAEFARAFSAVFLRPLTKVAVSDLSNLPQAGLNR